VYRRYDDIVFRHLFFMYTNGCHQYVEFPIHKFWLPGCIQGSHHYFFYFQSLKQYIQLF
jgi:hypothetical protein